MLSLVICSCLWATPSLVIWYYSYSYSYSYAYAYAYAFVSTNLSKLSKLSNFLLFVIRYLIFDIW